MHPTRIAPCSTYAPVWCSQEWMNRMSLTRQNVDFISVFASTNKLRPNQFRTFFAIRGRFWRCKTIFGVDEMYMRWDGDDEKIGPIKCKMQLVKVNEIKLPAKKKPYTGITKARQTKNENGGAPWPAHSHPVRAQRFPIHHLVAPFVAIYSFMFFFFFFSLAADAPSSLHTLYLYISGNLWDQARVPVY